MQLPLRKTHRALSVVAAYYAAFVKAPVTTAVTVYFCCGRRIGHCPSSRSIMLLCFVDGSEYVLDLVSDHVLDCLTGRFQILARIEVVRMLGHILTDRGCHCKSDI